MRLRAAVYAAILMLIPLVLVAGEPGSGVYAADCNGTKGRFTVEIEPGGTATVEYGGETYADQLTSYSFFGKATPADFHIAVLFDRNRTPLPNKTDTRSWLEIWKGEAAFYALPNGDKEKRLLFCAERPAAEAVGPDFDCSKASGAVEKLICDDRELARRDWALAGVYRKALGRIGGDDSEVRALKAEQRGWIKGRNDCWKAQDVRACVSAAYSDRHATLLARFGLIEAGPMQVWSCDGMAGPLYVTPFMTEPATINLVRGDETATAIRRPAASGSRYEAPPCHQPHASLSGAMDFSKPSRSKTAVIGPCESAVT
jgi:uncharacterized protein